MATLFSSKEFIIHTDHESLKYLRSQHTLNKRHAKWVEFLEQFLYMSLNIKRAPKILLLMVYPVVFAPIFSKCLQKPFDGFYLSDGYLFFKGLLCIPSGSIRSLLITESHQGGLMGHHGIHKTFDLLKQKFCWPHMRGDVQKHCAKCISFLQAKSKLQPHGLYMPLPVAHIHPGQTLVWISFLVYLSHLVDLILFLWWLIVSAK